MGITDFILPRWKHSNPDIRLKAIGEMDPSSLEILQKTAINDEDPRVAMEALRKIEDADALHNVISNVSDLTIIKKAWEKLNTIYKGMILTGDMADFKTRKSLINKVNGDEVLLSIATEADDMSIRFAAMERIFSIPVLCRVAESNCGPKIGAAIVDKLSEPSHLERLARKATGKKIRKMARDKLDALQEKESCDDSQMGLRKELESLCITIESLISSENYENAPGIILQAKNSWKKLDPDNKDELHERFLGAISAVEMGMDRAEALKKALGSFEEICVELEEMAVSLPDGIEEKLAPLAESPAKEAEDFVKDDPGFKKLEERFKKAYARCEAENNKRLKGLELERSFLSNLSECATEMEKAALTEDINEAETRWAELQKRWDATYRETPESLPLEKRVAAARENLDKIRLEADTREKEQKEKEEARLRVICAEVEEAVEAEKRAGLERKIKELQEEWKTAGSLVPEVKDELDPRFREGLDNFFKRQSEYWKNLDWERWANLNRKEELCAIIEALGAQDDLTGAANLVKDAQAKWKEIGPVARDKSEVVWQRFRQAVDAVFDRCLEVKKGLESEVGAIVSPIRESGTEDLNRVVNWNDSAKKIKDIQTRWNGIGYLPLSLEKDIRESFRAGCNLFFEKRREFFRKLDDERSENLKLKQGLCKEAEELAASRDWTKASSQLKELQRRWKEIGPIPKKEGKGLWEKFRAACNSFFERLDNEKPENLKRKEALCQEAENLLSSVTEETDLENMSPRFMEIQKEWKEIGPVPPEDSERLWEKFHTSCDEFFAMRKKNLDELKGEHDKNLELKEELIREAEAISDSIEWKETADKLKELQKRWQTLGSVRRKKERELWARFRKACDAFFTRRNEFFNEMDSQRMENLKEKEQLCLSLEVLAKVVMPEKAPDYYEGAPVAEQLSMGLDFKNEIVDPGDKKKTWERAIGKVRAIQKTWKSLGPVPNKYDKALWERYRRASDIFFSQRTHEKRGASNEGEKVEKD